jgi:DNA-binding transcriptional LysR family regulator
MTLDEIESFVCIAGGAGFTQASRRLLRSQPAISRRIRQLERGLGAALFERIGRSVRLTDAGRALLPHAEAVLAAARDGERAVRDLAGRRGAPAALRLAVVGTLADAHLIESLRAFRARHPQATLELRTANSREVSELVRRGEADLGLRYQADADRSLESIPLGAERVCVVVPAEHRVRAARVRDLRAFQEDAWLGFPPDPRQPEAATERRLWAAGIANPRVTPVDSLTAQKRLVEAGLGIAFLPRSHCRDELRRGTLRAIELAGAAPDTTVVLVRRRAGYASPLAEALLAELRRGVRRSLGRARDPRGARARAAGRAARR